MFDAKGLVGVAYVLQEFFVVVKVLQSGCVSVAMV
jgi:hypothetical protein